MIQFDEQIFSNGLLQPPFERILFVTFSNHLKSTKDVLPKIKGSTPKKTSKSKVILLMATRNPAKKEKLLFTTDFLAPSKRWFVCRISEPSIVPSAPVIPCEARCFGTRLTHSKTTCKRDWSIREQQPWYEKIRLRCRSRCQAWMEFELLGCKHVICDVKM